MSGLTSTPAARAAETRNVGSQRQELSSSFRMEAAATKNTAMTPLITLMNRTSSQEEEEVGAAAGLASGSILDLSCLGTSLRWLLRPANAMRGSSMYRGRRLAVAVG